LQNTADYINTHRNSQAADPNSINTGHRYDSKFRFKKKQNVFLNVECSIVSREECDTLGMHSMCTKSDNKKAPVLGKEISPRAFSVS
jgi:hypothetical protein